MKISAKSIYEDLNVIEEKLGIKTILLLCAYLIKNYCWWIWSGLKEELLTNSEINEQLKEKVNK
ncbi:MAG: hypothetical protein HYS25_01045 [Ignavibacteriales bacterium]|nr:hypothetical protein [Ignavibacteriales bacterium]